jgi:hypothetical protein
LFLEFFYGLFRRASIQHLLKRALAPEVRVYITSVAEASDSSKLNCTAEAVLRPRKQHNLAYQFPSKDFPMPMLFASQRFLAIYSGVLTLIFVVTVFAGFSKPSDRQKFAEIDVERINLVEPDGTLRMVISNKSKFPGIIIKGKETPHPDRNTAGMLFFNDEATENGGLIF